MKRLALTGIVTLTFALGAFAQGLIDLDNSTNVNGVAINSEGDHYTGTYGMEVWELSGATSVPFGITLAPGLASGQVAYDDMVAAGFKKEATLTNQTMTIPGAFTLGDLTLQDVTPAGSQVVLALAVWNTSDPSWVEMLDNATYNSSFIGSANCGVIAFLNPTANPAISPPSTPANLTGWASSVGDLVMTPLIPSRFLINGQLQVSISPPCVLTDGAQWRLDGGAWLNSGTIVDFVSSGVHTVAFSSVAGWITPPSQTVMVPAPASRTTATGTYTGGTPCVNGDGFMCMTTNGAITITGYSGSGEELSIPATINGLPVTSIGDNAFYDRVSLTTVTIPNSVTNIGELAFNYCSNLRSVTIGNGVTNIGEEAFYGCDNLTSVYFKGNAPSLRGNPDLVFTAGQLNVFYLPGATGWGTWSADYRTTLWNPHMQTGNASFGVRDNQFGFTITGNSGLVVVVEASSTLANPTWSPIQTITLTGGSFYFSDPQWPSYPTRFYRLAMP